MENTELEPGQGSQQTAEEIAAAQAAIAAANQKTVYTAEELAALTPTDIDIERVASEVRPFVQNTIRDYKNLQADHTRKSQELAELKKAPPEPEHYFDDPKKDDVFKEYLKSPGKALGEINAQIADLEAVILDDGIEEYKKARRQIAYWNSIKDEFQIKRIEVGEQHRNAELAEERVLSELGQDAAALIEHAKSLGFTERQFKTQPELRKAVKRLYDIQNASNTARTKEVKADPQKTAKTAGETGGAGGTERTDEDIIFDDKTTTAERMAIWAKKKRQ